MSEISCPTKRAVITTQAEAALYASRVAKGAQAQQCPFCGWWHVVGLGSPINRPSKPRPKRRR